MTTPADPHEGRSIVELVTCPDCGAEVFARWFAPEELDELTADGTLVLASFGEKKTSRVLVAVFHLSAECGIPCAGGRLPPGSVVEDPDLGDKIHRAEGCPYCVAHAPFDPVPKAAPEDAAPELRAVSVQGGILVDEPADPETSISPLFGGRTPRGAA